MPGFVALHDTEAPVARQAVTGASFVEKIVPFAPCIRIRKRTRVSAMSNLHLPPGYEAVEHPDGRTEVRKSADAILSHTIAVRLTTADHNQLRPFAETFPNSSWASAMRWLFTHPDVRKVMADRVNGAMTEATP